MQQSLRKFSFETAHYGKSSTSFFQNIFTSTDKGFISGAGLTTKSIKFWGFPDITLFPKILSLKLFGNSWGNSYVQVYC